MTDGSGEAIDTPDVLFVETLFEYGILFTVSPFDGRWSVWNVLYDVVSKKALSTSSKQILKTRTIGQKDLLISSNIFSPYHQTD